MGIRHLIILSSVFSLFLISSCIDSKNQKKTSTDSQTTASIDSSFYFTSTIKHAKGFIIEKHEGYKELSVFDPWNSGQIFQKYYLVPRGEKSNTILPSDGQVIEVPVRSIAALSSTQVGILKFLGVDDRIVAVSLPDRVYDEHLAGRVKKGEVIGVGHGQTLDFERLVDLSPEMVMVAGFMKISNEESRLMSAGLSLVFNIEWMESSPLARAEWAKFIAAFFNKELEADKLFSDLEKRYVALKTSVENVEEKPDVISGYHYKGIWYMSGGQSYLAQLLRDAKGEYCWFSDSTQGSIPLSFEVVLERQANSKIWFGPAQCRNLKEMQQLDDRYTLFQAYKNGQVYSVTKRTNDKGANDYYESSVINPDLMLKDVIKILHPDIFPEYELYFYRKLE